MNCFRHRHTDAIAVCRSCGRAVCDRCCEESGTEVVCGHTCRQERERSYQLDARLRQTFGVGARPPMPASVSAYFFFGLILLLTGVYFWFDRQSFDVLTFALSAAFFVMSAASFRQYKNSCLACR